MLRKLILLAYLALAATQIQAQSPSSQKKESKISAKRPAEKPQAANAWYDPAIKYVKLETIKDGVAKADLAEVLKLAPEWRGQPKANIKLINRGVEKPIYIDLPGDALDDAGSIYFLGSRARGDTTWNDNYASTEPYYLYLDPAGSSLRYTLAQFSGVPSQTLNKARVNLHFERDLRYNISDDFLNPETGREEGWFWAVLAPGNTFEKDKFTALLDVVPTGQPEDKIRASASIYSLLDSLKTIFSTYFHPEYDVSLLTNNDTIAQKRFKNIRRETLEGEYSGDELYSGLNEFSIYQKKLYEKDNGFLGVDYFTLEGTVRPWAGVDGAIYRTEPASDAILEVDGFRDGFVIALDTLNKEIQFPESIKGYGVKFGARNGSAPFVYATFAGGSYSSNDSGFHVVFLKDGDATGKNFGEDFEQAADYIEGYQGAAIAIYNGVGQISSRLKSSLKNRGAKIVDALSAGEAYAIFYETGVPASTVERRGGEGKVSYAGTIGSTAGPSAKARVRLTAGKGGAFAFSDAKLIEKLQISAVSPSYLREKGADSALQVVITHRDYKSEAERLAKHRMDRDPAITVRVVDVEDVFKEFSYGRKSPHAIREYLKIASNKSNKLKYVLLVGDASTDPRRNDPFSKSVDFVPTFGNPASDFWYGCFDPSRPVYSDMSIGRLPFKTAAEAKAVVDKLIDYDTMAAQPWMKSFLFLSGGGTEGESEKDEFYYFGYDLSNEMIVTSPLCATSSFVRRSAESDGTESQDIISNINNGAGWWNFLGHGALNIFDMDGWEVSKLSNYKRYGVLSTLACNTGGFADQYSPDCRNETYISAPNRGAIAAFGSTSLGWKGIHPAILKDMFKYMSGQADGVQHRRLGDLFFYAKNNLWYDMTQPGYEGSISSRYCFSYLGDPLTEYRIEEEPDLYMLDEELSIIPSSGNIEFSENDSLAIVSGKLRNAGIRYNGEYETLCVHTYEGKRDSLYVFPLSICTANNFTFKINVKEQPGRHLIEIYADPGDSIGEAKRDNNFISKEFYIYKRGLLPVEPFANWNVNATSPKFRVVNPEAAKGNFTYEFKISDRKDGSTIAESSPSEVFVRKNAVDWTPGIQLQPGARLIFSARLKFGAGGEPSGWMDIPFYASTESILDGSVIEKKMPIDFAGDKFDTTAVVDNGLVRLIDDRQSYELKGASVDGKKFMKFTLNGKIRHEAPYEDGMHIFVFSRQFDTTEPAHRHYDMWGGIWEIDSASIKLYRFLKDTVKEDQYVAIVNSGPGWPVLNKYQAARPTSIGGLDSLKALMKDYYASRLIDSIKQGNWTDPFDWRYSYAYVGKKGAKPGEIVEGLNSLGDTVTISGEITRPHLSGAYASLPIGPAAEWRSLHIGVEAMDDDRSNIQLVGIEKNGSESQLMVIKSPGDFDLSQVNAVQYPQLKLTAKLARQLDEIGPGFGDIKLAYSPPPEIAIAPDAVTVSAQRTMQGETLTTAFKIENISLRSDAYNVQTVGKLSQNNVAIEDTTVVSEKISSDAIAIFERREDTEKMHGDIKLSVTVDPSSRLSEPYIFNNSAFTIFNVYADTVPPTLKLTIDGVEPKFGDFVLAKPRVVITMEDNSPLDIQDSTNISIFLNGAYISSINSEDYKIELFRDRDRLKARISFTPKNLEYGDDELYPANNITVAGRDASGNSDTLDYSVNLALNAVANEALFYPNPSYGGSGKVSYKFRADNLNYQSIIQLYDMTGRKVGEWTGAPNLGMNIMNMDLRGLSPGVYFYRLSFTGMSYVAPTNGKLIISGS